MTNRERYKKAAHAMQSGVAMKMNIAPDETKPKHLRVGINAAMSDQGGLAKLLIDKGIITLDEYEKAVADQMELEAESYRRYLAAEYGADVRLI